jgi:formylglycine-generating enzyme required for sulfatase activity
MRCSAPLFRLLVAVLLSSLVAGLVLLDALHAQADKGKKHALLVGVRDYDSGKFRPLKYTENDAEEMARVLGKADFSVRVLTTTRGGKQKADAPTAANLRAAVETLLARKKRDDAVLVALAGHGIQGKVKGKDKEESFFCPADAQLNDPSTLLPLGQLFRDLDDCGAGVKLLLVDACRNDPAEGRNVDVETLPRLPRGTAALFSCSSGERAFESSKLGRGHGVFFYHVLQGLEGKAKNADGEVRWSGLAEYVTQSVSRAVPKLIGEGAQQTPELKVNLRGASPVLVLLRGREEAPAMAAEKKPGKEKVVKEGAKTITNSIGMKLVRIPAGKFLMGSTKEEQDDVIADYEKWTGKKATADAVAWYSDEGPRHEVEITKDFYLGIHEVTQKQYRTVMGTNPSLFSASSAFTDKVKGINTDNFPVEQVSWEDAVEFCKKLSALPAERLAGRKYRLPTEAEWEYSCRGGAYSSTYFHFGNSLSSKQATFDGNYPFGGAAKGDYLQRTCKVGSYKPNGFGLFDMHGNVEEWCSDWYGKDYYGKSPRRDPQGPASGSLRVHRGGGWADNGQGCRSASRIGGFWGAGLRPNSHGFRAAQVPSE